jgi:CheY-like chemotaxis protein
MGGVFRRRQPIFLGTIDIAFLGQVCATGATPDGIWLGLLALRGMCAEAPMPPNLNGIRVVVVEDHGDSREILEEMLRAYGAVVMTVSTASDALAIAPDADIILTDFALPPGEDGVWLLEQVNTGPRPIPVILVSGFSEHQDARLAAAPFARKLLKPVDPEQLCEIVATVLRTPLA